MLTLLLNTGAQRHLPFSSSPRKTAVSRRRRSVPALAVVAVASTVIEMARADQLATCNNAAEWMNNASGESPCTVAYFLMLQCAVEADFAVLPLDGSARSYGNPLKGQWCTCNTVVYNLMSACAVCQGGVSTDYITWTNGCTNTTLDYPETAIAESYHTPKWAYVDVNQGSFNIRSAEEVAGVKKGWSPLQIALPVAIGVLVALLAGIFFYFYRRRLKRRYAQISDPFSSRPTSVPHHLYSSSQQTIRTARPSHHQTPSSSSLGLHSLAGSSSSSSAGVPKRKRSAVAVAWERAQLHGPRKLGGLLADRRKVHTRTRGADWSIDIDQGDSAHPYYDPWNYSSGSGSHSKETSGDGQGHKEAQGSHGSRSTHLTRPSRHNRSESQLGLLSTEQLHPIQDSPDLNREHPTPAFARGILHGLNTIGYKVGLSKRPPPVAVVSKVPRRGFKMDDVDSAASPTVHGKSEESYVFVEEEQEEEGVSDFGLETGSFGNRVPTRLNVPIVASSATNQCRAASGSGGGSSGSGGHARSDGSANIGNNEREVRVETDVILISQGPGQDVNSIVSPMTEETSDLGPYHASPASENWPAAMTDASSVLHPSFERAQRPRRAPPLPPSPMSLQSYNAYSKSNSRSNSPSRPAPGTPRPPFRVSIPPGTTSTQQLVPPSIRAAGRYTPPLQSQPQPQDVQYARSPPPQLAPILSPTSMFSRVTLPNTRLFGSDSVIESLAPMPEPRSAVSYATAGTPTAVNSSGSGSGMGNAGSVSEHGSSEAYTVPNPFTFDERHGGSGRAANALQLARSASRTRLSADFIE